MPFVTELDLPEFDYLDPTLTGARFHDVLEELHRRSWVARSPFAYFVFDRKVVDEMLRDRSLASPLRRWLELAGITDPAWLDWRLKGAVQAAMGADHAKLRQAVAPAFTPKAIARLRASIRGLAERLWDEIAPRGRCDFVADYALRLPGMAIAELLGVPDDYERLARWSTEMGRMFALGDPDAAAAVIAATAETHAFIIEILAERERRPTNDLLSVLAAASAGAGRLTRDECAMLTLDLIQGGTKTTAAQLGHLMRLFVEHPDQWQVLRDRPDLVSRATEEVLRFEPMAPFDPRLVPDDRKINGVTFPAGSLVFACITTANRDPALFERPGEFDVTAERKIEHFSFAPGMRYCLGASLARAEIEETLAILPRRMRELRADGEMIFGPPSAGIYAMRAVPIAFAT
ncbi:MAG: cytochrome P450, partial [Candidatus Binatia bacterium]